ncbi:MAG: recombination protein RecR [Patescibacteria group bacterium]|nr:recombination protein RecR [Patescibacteria group bacterium]
MHKDRLVEHFRKFPGIGPKQAERFVYFLMKQNQNFLDNFINNIKELKQYSIKCVECERHTYLSTHNPNEKHICDICSDENRDGATIMIVEKEMDIDSIEKSGIYTGVYFVLGGHLPFLAQDPKEYISIESLTKRIFNKIKNNSLNEIVFALPVSDEGDNEMEYIKKVITQIVGMDKVKISTLARGVSTGLEMEYVDHDTFKYAFDARK